MKKKQFISLLLAGIMVCSHNAYAVCAEELPVTAGTTVTINAANFPDETFCSYVAENFDTDGNGSLSATELSAVREIYVSNQNISDLTGIAYFTELTALNCEMNRLTALDVSKNSQLVTLYCGMNKLVELDVSENLNLTALDCRANKLTALDAHYNTELKNLWCFNNDLMVLNVSCNTKLERLECFGNDLKALDVSKAMSLRYLQCNNNQLTSLDVSKNTQLNKLTCNYNRLTALDVSKNVNLLTLECSNNQLTALDLSKNIKLTSLKCENNSYPVAVEDEKTFSVSDLPDTFNASKVIAWGNATRKGTVITVTDFSKGKVTYTYNAGYTTPLTFTLFLGVPIDETRFPDENFRAYILQYIDKDKNGMLSKSEITAASGINLPGYNNAYSVSDLTGISYFTELERLNCSNTQLSALDVSSNTKLSYLYLTSNQLTSLQIGNNPVLEELYCNGNQLSALDVSGAANLDVLWCQENALTALDVSKNVNLTSLRCSSNQLTALDVTKNTKLAKLYCNDNQLAALDLSRSSALAELDCSNNQLIRLDLSKNPALKSLIFYGNHLTSLNLAGNPLLSTYNASNYGAAYNNYEITTVGKTFDLTTLQEGFDPEKTYDWTNAERSGSMLTISNLSQPVTYMYETDSVKGKTFNATLHVTGVTMAADMLESIEPVTYSGQTWTPEPAVDLSAYPELADEEISVTYSYRNNVHAGTGTVTVTAGGSDFVSGSVEVPFTISQAKSIVHPILSAQSYTSGDSVPTISLTAGDTPGAIFWLEGTPDTLTAGNHELVWEYVPDNTVDYQTMTGTITVTVSQAKPVVHPVLSAQNFTSGDPVPSISLTAGDTPGTIFWQEGTPDILTAGKHELTWEYVPNDAAEFQSATGTISIIVSRGLGLLGDADCDGEITLMDATLVLTYYAEHAVGNDFVFSDDSIINEQIVKQVDVDGDGEITLTDATVILTYYAEHAVGNAVTWEELTA